VDARMTVSSQPISILGGKHIIIHNKKTIKVRKERTFSFNLIITSSHKIAFIPYCNSPKNTNAIKSRKIHITKTIKVIVKAVATKTKRSTTDNTAKDPATTACLGKKS
jgi:hypothetical protein